MGLASPTRFFPEWVLPGSLRQLVFPAFRPAFRPPLSVRRVILSWGWEAQFPQASDKPGVAHVQSDGAKQKT